METPLDSLHSWHLVDAPPSVAETAHAIDAALARGHATLAYGEHCFEFTYSVEVRGACFLRLEEVGRLTMTGSGRSILIFARDGYHAEQRIAPCRDGFDAEVLPNLNASALQALGLALLDDAARDLDDEERST